MFLSSSSGVERPPAFGLLYKDSARPVYLRELAAVAASCQKEPPPRPSERPPERPPKRPHLRGQTRSGSGSASSSSSSPSSSRVTTPTRPKFPSPPGSPKMVKPPSPDARELPPAPPPPPPPALSLSSPSAPSSDTSPTSSSQSSLFEMVKMALPADSPVMPKRDSPAMIAAKAAPGWEKFLRVKTSTSKLTTDEQTKLTSPPRPPPKPRKPAPLRGEQKQQEQSCHAHSNSDSSLSSLSGGRSSTKSPVSTVSTVSSGSSTSSRTSMRSASTVSHCTIALDEEEEECKEDDPERAVVDALSRLDKPRPEEEKLLELFDNLAIKMPSDYLDDFFDFGQDKLEENGKMLKGSSVTKSSFQTPKDEEIRPTRTLLSRQLEHKLESLRLKLARIKEASKHNEDNGRKVAIVVRRSARPNEFDKYKLHVEETDKIASLASGLASRLARVENALAAANTKELKVQLTAKRDKLCDQLMEARDLKTNIDRRSSNIAHMLSGYLGEETFKRYQMFLRTKTRLIVESRDLQERIALDEEKLTAIKETA